MHGQQWHLNHPGFVLKKKKMTGCENTVGAGVSAHPIGSHLGATLNFWEVHPVPKSSIRCLRKNAWPTVAFGPSWLCPKEEDNDRLRKCGGSRRVRTSNREPPGGQPVNSWEVHPVPKPSIRCLRKNAWPTVTLGPAWLCRKGQENDRLRK